MKTHMNASEKRSRRGFSKTAVSALVAALAISSLSSCTQTTNTTNQQASNSSNQQASNSSNQSTTKQDATTLDKELLTHNPPIIVDGGSLKLDSPDELGANTRGTILPHRRPGPAGYKNIEIVQVVTERKYTVRADPYFLEDGAKLKLWLQKQRQNGTFENLTADPQVIFFSGDPFAVETDEMLRDKDNSFKKHRPNRYNHPGHGGFRGFRIAKWEITKADNTRLHGASVEDAGSEDNNYQILLSFGH